MKSDYFEGEKVPPKKEYFSFEKVGDKITGVYIGKIKNSVMDKWGKIKIEYIFKTKDGIKFVSGRNLSKDGVQGVDYNILYDMQNKQPGTVMGLKFSEERDVKKGNLLKIITAFFPDKLTLEPDAVDVFNEEFGMFYNLETGEDKTVPEEEEVEDEINVKEAF